MREQEPKRQLEAERKPERKFILQNPFEFLARFKIKASRSQRPVLAQSMYAEPDYVTNVITNALINAAQRGAGEPKFISIIILVWLQMASSIISTRFPLFIGAGKMYE